MGEDKREPFRTEYWLVLSKWEEVIEESKVDPLSQGRTLVRPIEVNEVINVHPILHGVMGLQMGRRNFRVGWGTMITKAQYDFVMGGQPKSIEDQAAEIARRIENQVKEKQEATPSPEPKTLVIEDGY